MSKTYIHMEREIFNLTHALERIAGLESLPAIHNEVAKALLREYPQERVDAVTEACIGALRPAHTSPLLPGLEPIAWKYINLQTGCKTFLTEKLGREWEELYDCTPLYASAPVTSLLPGLERAADLVEAERCKMGAIDGYDYTSGQEYGLRLATIIVGKEISRLKGEGR